MAVDTATEVIGGIALAGSVGMKDLSLWGLILQADAIVKFVMVVLLFASIWCWGIIFEKYRLMRQLKALTKEFEHNFFSGMSLEALYKTISQIEKSPITSVFAAGMKEWQKAIDQKMMETHDQRTEFKERLERVLRLRISKEVSVLEKSISFLASVGSVAPFIGLFGTVWGIMNSFQGIAATHNTSLVVVAPGIAEALLATAMGLFAAIPAYLAYNKYSQDCTNFANHLDDFSDEFLTIVSRHMQENS